MFILKSINYFQNTLTTQLLVFLWLVVSLIAVWKLFIYPTFFDPLRHLPNPKTIVPWETSFEHLKRPPSEKEFHRLTTIPNDGLIRQAAMPGKYELIPTTPRVLSELFVTKAYDFHKPEEGRALLRTILGDGLVVTEDDIHRFQRKNLNPMFSFRKIKDLYPLMWSKSIELVHTIRKEIEQAEKAGEEYSTDVNMWASRATLDIIGVSALGTDLNALKNADEELVRLYEDLFRIDTAKKLWFALGLVLPPFLVDFIPSKTKRDILEKSQSLRRICARFVADKRNAIKSHQAEAVDILAHLIWSENFSDQDLVDQLLTILAAGHETTSSMLTWVLGILSQNPSYQNRLRQELKEALPTSVLESPDSQLSNILESLPLLNALCYETSRLYPTVPTTRRIAIHDTEIMGLKISKGTAFRIPIWWLNRLPSLWGSDAVEFRPERWIDLDTGKPNNHGGAVSNYALLTFLHGPRSCIGQGFAKAELRCLLAAWVMAFEFELANPTEQLVPDGVVTLKPKNGLHLKIREVKQ